MELTGWLIYSKQDALSNEGYIKWFIDEASQQHLSLELVLREDLEIGIKSNKLFIAINNAEAELPNVAIVRTLEPLLNLHLEELGIHVFNSASVSTICNNKALTHLEVNKLGVPMVDTLFAKKEKLTAAPPMNFPFVMKETSGRGGKQVFFIENNVHWTTCLTQLKTSDVIIQTSNVQLGKDIRVFVVGKKVIGAVLRESNSDFRANYTLGGSATWYTLNENELATIRTISNHFDFGMVGIDFLIDHNGNLLFNEIEDIVGSRTLSAITEINILEIYVKHIIKKVAGLH